MPTALLQNETLLQSAYSPIDAPEVLFRRIEDCQEIQTDDPYTPMQLLNNAIRLLLGCGLYQRDFKEWDDKSVADKVWTNLKPFIQEAYQQQLNATGNTAGKHRYMQNVLSILRESDEDKDEDVAPVIMQMATLTAVLSQSLKGLRAAMSLVLSARQCYQSSRD